MNSEEVPEGRCGFVLEVEDVERGDSYRYRENEEWHENSQAVCCWRETWNDSGLCIWHAETKQKPVQDLKKARADKLERLDGAHLSGVAGEQEFSFNECNLNGSDLSGANFSGCDFEEAHLEGADLEGANLSGSNFIKANLENASLKNVDLRIADLTESSCESASFQEADLHGASLMDSTFLFADFKDANLVGADFRESSPVYADFRRADICPANFKRAAPINAKFQEADLSGIDFEEADLDGAIFEKAELRAANLNSAKLKGVNLKNANLSSSDLKGAALQSTNLENTDARESDIEGANLSDANLRNADFRRAKLQKADLRDGGLEGTTLRDADLENANLEDASLINTDLRRAKLQDARLYQTYFSDIRINSDAEFGNTCVYEDLEELEDWNATPTEAAIWTYRRLQDLHEKYALTDRARQYHVKKAEAEKRRHWEEGNWFQWAVYAGNGLVSKHGERPWRVVGISGLVIAIWSVLYLLLGQLLVPDGSSNMDPIGYGLFPSVSLPAPLGEIATSIYFSVVTFTTLGYGDLQPATGFAQALATVESFLGALLMAYLVFVLGRRTNW